MDIRAKYTKHAMFGKEEDVNNILNAINLCAESADDKSSKNLQDQIRSYVKRGLYGNMLTEAIADERAKHENDACFVEMCNIALRTYKIESSIENIINKITLYADAIANFENLKKGTTMSTKSDLARKMFSSKHELKKSIKEYVKCGYPIDNLKNEIEKNQEIEENKQTEGNNYIGHYFKASRDASRFISREMDRGNSGK